MNVFVLLVNGTLFGAFSTLSIAQQAKAAVEAADPNAKVEGIRLVVDGLNTRLAAGEKPFAVTFPNAGSSANARVQRLPFEAAVDENDFTYSSRTRTFRVVVWAADATAAETEGDAQRAIFAANNGL